MRSKLLNVILFTTGAAIGSLVTWKIVHDKYSRIAQEEIDSVKKEYRTLMQKMKENLKNRATCEDSQDADGEEVDESEEDDFSENESEMTEYHNIIKRYDRVNDYENGKEGGIRDDEDYYEAPYINGPYVISPDEFSSSPPGYNAQSVSYFSDGVLADDWGVVLDIEETIGEESIDHFGEYADDIVYVRNERNELDYEVTKDPRTYTEFCQSTSDPYYNQ